MAVMKLKRLPRVDQPGQMWAEMHVRCGRCPHQDSSLLQERGRVGEWLKKLGWQRTRAWGWVCPTCVRDNGWGD